MQPIMEEPGAARRIHLREISGDSEAPLETVGQDLRAARLRRGDDIATVSRALKIGKDHLTSLEEDNMENLPGKTYAIGFVRSYAGYLGLNAAQMVDRFKLEIAGRHDEQQLPASSMMVEERRLPNGWRIVAGIVILALAYGVWHIFSPGTPSQTVPPAPVIATPRPAPPPAPEPAPAPQPDQSSANMPAANAPAATAPAPVPATPTPAQTATPSPAAPVNAAAVPAVPTENQGNGRVFGSLNHDARVILKARGDTHILVRGRDGMVYINRNLKPGDSYQLPNIVGLSLTTTNAGAVELSLDGVAMGRAGAELQTVGDIPLDPQAIADRGRRR